MRDVDVTLLILIFFLIIVTTPKLFLPITLYSGLMGESFQELPHASSFCPPQHCRRLLLY
eukprot:529618-Karenia_brevis.AAC.1